MDTQNTFPQLLRLICNGAPIHLMRQDWVYELYRRRLLITDTNDKLVVSEQGKAALEQLDAGIPVPLLEPPPLDG